MASLDLDAEQSKLRLRSLRLRIGGILYIVASLLLFVNTFVVTKDLTLAKDWIAIALPFGLLVLGVVTLMKSVKSRAPRG